MSQVINIQTNNLEHTLAEIVSKYQPTEEHSVVYNVDIRESSSDKCVVVIDDDEYIIEVKP